LILFVVLVLELLVCVEETSAIGREGSAELDAFAFRARCWEY